MNCPVKVIQDNSWLPSPTPVLPTPKKTAPIKSKDDLIKHFPDSFQGIGQFPGEYTIKLCDDAQPVIHAPQKCPISIHPRVKVELDKMVKLGVTTPVDEPTDRISSGAYAWKTSGEFCLSLDPHDLNNVICRDHHYTPTMDEVAHEFTHSKYFIQLDARHGHWAVILDSKSSLFTTFNTPYSQCCFLHLPFGLACSQIVFWEKDGSNTGRMWRMHWDCWWYHHPWPYRSQTWCLPMEAHGSCLEVWVSCQPQENTSQSPSGEVLWMPLWWVWSPSRSREGWCCTIPAHTN